MRFFNTTGPVDPREHYCIPPLERLDLEHVLRLIRQRRYFVLHAPRQTGKTSTLLALRDRLNVENECRCVYVNVEIGQSARADVAAGMRALLSALAREAHHALADPFLAGVWAGILDSAGPHDALGEALSRWAASNPTPLVLLVDEIDTLIGDTLIAVLRQLRAGYHHRRPKSFPQSVILCGVRDVRDYRIHSAAEGALVTGGSAFNVKAASLRLGDFSEADTRALVAQHADETGRTWTPEALALIWRLTRGQPWLVNALAAEITDGEPDTAPNVEPETVQQARERIILRRETHLDQLADKLQEERVRRVVEPLLSGGDESAFSTRDLEYVQDLGLVAADAPLRIANPIYAEVLPRELTWAAQAGMIVDPAWFVSPTDGRLLMPQLLAAFQTFFREHSEHWVERFDYKEAGPQLLLQAFLQRVVNSGGRIEREYGLDRRRTDLLVVRPRRGGTQHVVIECNIRRGGRDRTIALGIEQTRTCMDRCAAAEGHLVVFDRNPDTPWADRLFRREETAGGAPVTIWGM